MSFLFLIFILMWFKNKCSGGSSNTRSCSGSIQRIVSEGVIHPHLLAVSVPSSLSNADPTSQETIYSDDNATFKGTKPNNESKSRFLRHQKKSFPSRTSQRVKNLKESRSGSLSSSDNLNRNVGKNFRRIFSEQRKSKVESYTSSTMLSTPIHDLQMFGSVPPTPTLGIDSNQNISSNVSVVRNKSATLPNPMGSNFVSLFDKISIKKFGDSFGNNEWFAKSAKDKSANSFNNCPCSSCKEKRWIGAAGNNYQFPARSQSDWITSEALRQQSGFYYNSNPVTGLKQNEFPFSTERKANYDKQNTICNEPSNVIYANLGAIHSANGELMKSKSNDYSRCKDTSPCSFIEEFHSLPKNFVGLFLHPRLANKTVSESENSCNILCPSCGSIFHYNMPREIAKMNLERRRMVLSEPATPTDLLKDNPLHNIYKASKLLALISSPEIITDDSLDYLQPNKIEQKINIETEDFEISSGSSTMKHMPELQLLYMVPPPQCHSPETKLKLHNYENGENWRLNNSSTDQMNYITYAKSDNEGVHQFKKPSKSGVSDKDKRSSMENPSVLKEHEVSDIIPEDQFSGVDVKKYEIKKDGGDQLKPNIYLRPRPQEPTSNFPYVHLVSSDSEIEHGSKGSKHRNVVRKPTFSRLPPLKENVAFFI